MIDQLPPLREIIARHSLSAQKSLGQCFLFDLNLTAKIARQAGDLENVPVLEIGPGPGGLTRALLAQGAKVIAIERDARCLAILEEIAEHYPQKLTLIHGDALKQDYAALFPSQKPKIQKPKIIANLPYNVGTQLLLNWLGGDWPPFYQSLTLMFQKEVAQRITALPNSPHYGRLSVLANWRAETKIVLNLPAAAFTPPPKVASAVVHMVPRANPLPCSLEKLEKITHYAFAQRRKMLRQSLKKLGGQSLLDEAGIDGDRRAETLSVEEFVRLANLL